MINLTSLLGRFGKWFTDAQVYGGGRGGKRGRRPASAYHQGTLPADNRWWHDIADPVQAERFRAAQSKRFFRAEKVISASNQSWRGNYAHHNAFHRLDDASGYILPLNLNPFYIAK